MYKETIDFTESYLKENKIRYSNIYYNENCCNFELHMGSIIGCVQIESTKEQIIMQVWTDNKVYEETFWYNNVNETEEYLNGLIESIRKQINVTSKIEQKIIQIKELMKELDMEDDDETFISVNYEF